MTICTKNSAESAKFFARCLAQKTCERDRVNWNFDKIQMLTLFNQISVETKLSIEDVKRLLAENKIKFLWVSEC